VIDESVERGQTAVLVCAPALRPAIRRFVAPQVGGLPVLSYQEVTTAQVPIETIGVVRAFDPIPA
jgi:flagellar biosynthesis protein FlhA